LLLYLACYLPTVDLHCFAKVVERTTKARAAQRHNKIKEYFYGLGERLYPHTFDVRFSDIHIYKVGGGSFCTLFILLLNVWVVFIYLNLNCIRLIDSDVKIELFAFQFLIFLIAQKFSVLRF